MNYLLQDLVSLPLLERLAIIEQVINNFSGDRTLLYQDAQDQAKSLQEKNISTKQNFRNP